MAKPVSLSLSKFTSSVQSAVKAAAARHPKFKFEAPQAVTINLLIWGFPPPESVIANATLSETQAFVNEVALDVADKNPGAFALPNPGPEGAIFSVGRHVICGIPPVTDLVVEK
jgi:hypothetical protein